MAEVVIIPLWDKAPANAGRETTSISKYIVYSKSAEMAEVVKALVWKTSYLGAIPSLGTNIRLLQLREDSFVEGRFISARTCCMDENISPVAVHFIEACQDEVNEWRDIIMYYVYLLRSKLDQKLYTGYTSDLKKRLREHQTGNVESTRNRRPMELIYYEAYQLKTLALQREKFLKTTKGKLQLRKQFEKRA